jgi:hypothetical protein
MRLSRILGMGMGEWAERSRQELLKRLERAGFDPQPPPLPGDFLSGWQTSAASRFFPGATSPDTTAALAARWPDASVSAIHAASRARDKRFDLLGYRELSFGDPVDWRLDPVSGRRAPRRHWSRIDPLDSASLGDHKVIWELNRHQWLVSLGYAYQASKDESYATALTGFVADWIQSNPPGEGINWASSLEAALRVIAWCWAAVLIRDSAALSGPFFAAWLQCLRRHALHVERHLSHYFSPNTHLTGEALGLFYAGALFEELPEASRWRALAARILVEQIEKQVLADGVYFEQSTYYQRYTVEIYLHFLILAARNGLVVAERVAEKVQAMLDFLLCVRRPDGSIPEIGDADGGFVFPLTSRPPEDARGLFSVAAAFFGRPDFAWAGGSTAEVLWLLGADGLATLEGLSAAPPATAPSRAFPDGGYAVMRSGWDEHAHHMVLDAGPLGGGPTAGHGHADLLALECSARGTPFLVDPGTFTYSQDSGWRTHFRTTRAHSTIMIDGLDQAEVAGPFSWRSRPTARLRRWHSTEAIDFVDAEHDAYANLADPVTVRRRVLFVKPRFWILVDDIGGNAEHRIDLRLQFAPLTVALEGDHWARASSARGTELLIGLFAPVPIQAELSEGLLDPPRGWIAPHYGQRRSAPSVVYSTKAILPLRIVSLLWPTDEPGVAPPSVRLLGENHGPDALLLESNALRIRFSEPVFVVERE